MRRLETGLRTDFLVEDLIEGQFIPLLQVLLHHAANAVGSKHIPVNDENKQKQQAKSLRDTSTAPHCKDSSQ